LAERGKLLIERCLALNLILGFQDFMVRLLSTCRLLRVFSLATLPLCAQGESTPLVAIQQTPAEAPVTRNATDAAISTRKDARAITLRIPAPRGQIVDREGEPLANNRVAYQVGLQFRQFENADRSFVIHWARSRLDGLKLLVKNAVPKSDDEIYDHYRNRRWLPLLVTGQLDEKEANGIEARLMAGLILHPIYRRSYPNGELAAHILGYSGSVGKLPTGPINFNEPLWEESEGRAGLEKIYNTLLTGEPGMKRLLFDENGSKLLEEQVKRPRPGGTVVTTLNLKWQKLAEATLRDGCRRGAFVVIDVATGEVLVMASRPSFDLNRFIPGINDLDFKALEADAAQPLFGRAFQSAYPPASCFKPIVALAALDKGTVGESTTIDCPAAITIGNATFNNWTRIPEGSIDVKRALARSCNTWFYQVGIDVGAGTFLSLARSLGFGSRTGLPLIGESPGLVPNDEWMLKNEKRRILPGDTANLSIGQGSLLASPLQVAQAMAGIANGGALPKLQLIRQIQDIRAHVVEAAIPQRKNLLGVDPHAVEIVRAGMRDVVNSGGGTGHGAGLSYTELCGKTGTAQWGPKAKSQRLAWFAGFLPHDNPRYAFAVLYEGRPGETVSGGRMAAPMVRKFFEGIKDDIKDEITPPKKALVVGDETAPKAEPVPLDPEGNEPPVAIPVEPLKALPVESFEAEPSAPKETSDVSVMGVPPAKPRAMRAIPVGEDEVIQDNVEEP
jgi:penicillin-binding protein 2